MGKWRKKRFISKILIHVSFFFGISLFGDFKISDNFPFCFKTWSTFNFDEISEISIHQKMLKIYYIHFFRISIFPIDARISASEKLFKNNFFQNAMPQMHVWKFDISFLKNSWIFQILISTDVHFWNFLYIKFLNEDLRICRNFKISILEKITRQTRKREQSLWWRKYS